MNKHVQDLLRAAIAMQVAALEWDDGVLPAPGAIAGIMSAIANANRAVTLMKRETRQ
jgi:hypothetical protein